MDRKTIFDHRSNNPKSRTCVIDSYRPSYHSLGSFALSSQLQYTLLLGEGATLNGKGVYRGHYRDIKGRLFVSYMSYMVLLKYMIS